jgi:hypothetical protein
LLVSFLPLKLAKNLGGSCRYMYILYRSLINVVSDVVFDIVVPYHT